MAVSLSRRDRLHLAVQRQISHLFFPLVATATLLWLRWVRRLKLRGPSTIRQRFRELVPDRRPPILVCSNHLTLFDSMILAWALAPIRSYLIRFDTLPWNVPEKANFSGTAFWDVTAYLGKCIFVSRGGPREEVRLALARLAHLLESRQLVSIFPEGGRSRTGRVDTEGFAYGTGRLLQAVPDAAVLCIYLRGRRQESYSDLPLLRDEYSLSMELIRPATPHAGLRGARDLASQVIMKLAEMEAKHLADRE